MGARAGGDSQAAHSRSTQIDDGSGARPQHAGHGSETAAAPVGSARGGAAAASGPVGAAGDGGGAQIIHGGPSRPATGTTAAAVRSRPTQIDEGGGAPSQQDGHGSETAAAPGSARGGAAAAGGPAGTVGDGGLVGVACGTTSQPAAGAAATAERNAVTPVRGRPTGAVDAASGEGGAGAPNFGAPSGHSERATSVPTRRRSGRATGIAPPTAGEHRARAPPVDGLPRAATRDQVQSRATAQSRGGEGALPATQPRRRAEARETVVRPSWRRAARPLLSPPSQVRQEWWRAAERHSRRGRWPRRRSRRRRPGAVARGVSFGHPARAAEPELQ